MDPSRFDSIVRALVASPTQPRRGALRLLGAGVFGLLGAAGLRSDVVAHDALTRCKKISNKKKRKQCIKKAREHNAGHGGPVRCGSVTCAVGQKCCKDEKCGAKCCANGRACNVVCSGPHGNDYCCHESRPVSICGGCWVVGSTQCSTPGHCCGPNKVCCGDDHCCNVATQQCRVNCGGVQGSNSCCALGDAPGCCVGGVSG